jgi:hypothetical protein
MLKIIAFFWGLLTLQFQYSICRRYTLQLRTPKGVCGVFVAIAQLLGGGNVNLAISKAYSMFMLYLDYEA